MDRVPRIVHISRCDDTWLNDHPEIDLDRLVSRSLQQERQNLERRERATRALILAAGPSRRLGDLTRDRPVSLLPIGRRTLIEHQIDALARVGIKDVAMVRGFRREDLHPPGVEFIDNPFYSEEGPVGSLARAWGWFERPTIILYADVFLESEALEGIVDAEGEIVLALDPEPKPEVRAHEYVWSAPGPSFERVEKLVYSEDMTDANREFMGLMRISPAAALRLKGLYDRLRSGGMNPSGMQMATFFQKAIESGEEIRGIVFPDSWTHIDTPAELGKVWSRVRNP